MERRDLQRTQLSTGYQRSLQSGWALILWLGMRQLTSVTSLALDEVAVNALLVELV